MQRAKEAMKVSDGSFLGDLGHTPLSKKQGIKWQRPRLTRQALTRCCLVKWILSSAAPQGSGAILLGWRLEMPQRHLRSEEASFFGI